jgi:hypothetical protein
LGILRVDATKIGFILISSLFVGLVFFTGTEADRSCEIVFVDEEFGFTPLIGRASIDDDDEVGFETIEMKKQKIYLIVFFLFSST